MLNDMKNNYDAKYLVNGEIIFSITEDKLKKIFEEFPNHSILKQLVEKINGLYFYCFLLFYFQC